MIYNVISIGEPVIDFVPMDTEHGLAYRAFPGGGAVNVLAQVCALGGKALLLGAVGQDVFGDFLLEEIKKTGIDISGIHRTDVKHTGLSFIRYSRHGERTFWSYRDHEADVGLWNEAGKDMIDSCRIFHFTSISLVGKKQREDTLQAAAYAKRRGKKVSFDVNYREDMWKCPEEARNIFVECIRQADIVKLSEEERDFLCPGKSNLECVRCLDEAGGKIIFISLGARGSFYNFAGGYGACPSIKVDAADTTGCGDAFMGAILAQLSDCVGGEGLDGVSYDHMEQMVSIANGAGAICATKFGALTAVPSWKEIFRFLKDGK